MRSDVGITEALARCDVLKRAGVWPTEPRLRPRAWINNFEEADRAAAAMLLNRFTYYNASMSDRLLISAYLSLSDGMQKGPQAATTEQITAALPGAFFTPVEGEQPNPTDSGNFLCRRARQVLKVPEDRIVTPEVALEKAYQGATIVFLDDFVGSGDQFISTWERTTGGRSFQVAEQATSFMPIYVSMACLKKGISRIHSRAPRVAVSTSHILEERSTLEGVMSTSAEVRARLGDFLRKYSSRLTPNEPYIASNASYKVNGYKNGGLMLAFEHSVPDATLPIFWSSGDGNWTPLLERA